MMHDVLADAAGDEGGKGAFAAVSHDDYVCFQFLDCSDMVGPGVPIFVVTV